MKIKSIKFKKVESTNDEAVRLIKKNVSQATLITSERQSKGRGRMGKKWLSLKGNLFLSIYFEINQRLKIIFPEKHFFPLNAFQLNA